MLVARDCRDADRYQTIDIILTSACYYDFVTYQALTSETIGSYKSRVPLMPERLGGVTT